MLLFPSISRTRIVRARNEAWEGEVKRAARGRHERAGLLVDIDVGGVQAVCLLLYVALKMLLVFEAEGEHLVVGQRSRHRRIDQALPRGVETWALSGREDGNIQPDLIQMLDGTLHQVRIDKRALLMLRRRHPSGLRPPRTLPIVLHDKIHLLFVLAHNPSNPPLLAPLRLIDQSVLVIFLACFLL